MVMDGESSNISSDRSRESGVEGVGGSENNSEEDTEEVDGLLGSAEASEAAAGEEPTDTVVGVWLEIEVGVEERTELQEEDGTATATAAGCTGGGGRGCRRCPPRRRCCRVPYTAVRCATTWEW